MRKYIIILGCLFVTMGNIYAQGIEFFHGTYKDALSKAQAEGKQIFVDVYTSWCGPCKMMAKNVFTAKEVGEYYNSKFVCLKLDDEKESGHEFFKNYQANGYPSFFWLDAQGRLLDTKTGFVEAAEFIKYGKEAVNSDLAFLLEKGRKRWESGERSLELVNDYVLGVLQRVHPNEVAGCILDYLSTLSEEELLKKENYKLMVGFMRMPKDNIAVRSLLRNAEVYQGYEKGDEFWIKMYRMIVRGGSVLRDKPDAYDAHLKLVNDPTFANYSAMYMDILSMEKVLFEKDFNQGIPRALEIADKYSERHPYLYSQFFYTLIIAGFFDDSVQNRALTDLAITLAENALKHTPSKETLLYLAASYAKKNDYKKAYELMASMPFFPNPILSTALYPHLHLSAIHHQYLKKR